MVGGGTNDLVEVSGNLTLDGILNITDLGGFAEGTYRLFNYSGSLTDNGLTFGIIPGPFELIVDTTTGSQIDLLVSNTTELFWDGSNTAPNGAIDGGSGTWDASTTNWTNSSGNANTTWSDGITAIFSTTGGVVTLADGFVASVLALDFRVDGYSIAATGSGMLNFAGATTVNVDTGTAEISAPISGAGVLEKTGAGTLSLTGINTYTGGTTVAGGTLSLGSDSAAGTGAITSTGAVIDYADGVTIGNPITLNSDSTQLQVSAGSANQAGVISEIGGSRPLEKIGAGALILTADHIYTGPTTISAGELILNGSLAGDVSVAPGAMLSGTGIIIGNLVNSGLLTAGNSPGILQINGDLSLNSNGTLLIEIAGREPGQYDQLLVGGTATLGGTLMIELLYGFVPTAGDRFDLVVSDNVTGSFDDVTSNFDGPLDRRMPVYQYVALFLFDLFDPEGHLVDHKIEKLGPRAQMDNDTRCEWSRNLEWHFP